MNPFCFWGTGKPFVGAFFSTDKKTCRIRRVYTISSDGAIFSWDFEESPNLDDSKGDISDPPPGTPEQKPPGRIANEISVELENDDIKPMNLDGLDAEESKILLHRAKWELVNKDFFMQSPEKLTACDYHRELYMVVVGFSHGVFGLYQMPDFVCIHLLSMSREKITTAVFNKLGNWLAFGCAKLGQLLVWEWRSGSYILKRPGHYFDVNCIAYSPDSQMLATGADNNKVKVWTVSSRFCFITFSKNAMLSLQSILWPIIIVF